MNRKNIAVITLFVVVALVLVYMYTRPHNSSNTVTPPVITTTLPAASTAATSQCTASELTATLDATGGGTAGTQYQQLDLVNHSSLICTITGFPGVSLVDSNGVQLGSPASRSGSAGAAITLAPGAQATAAIGFPDASNFPTGSCTGPSSNLKVYPPNQTTALNVPLAVMSCPGFSIQALVAK